MKKAAELVNQTEAELNSVLGKLRRSQFKLRLARGNGEEAVKTHKFKEIRRQIARVMTRLTQIKEGKQL